MATIHVIDLHHLGRPRVIAAHLLEGTEPTVVDCGPASCLATLREGLAARGLEIGDLRHLLLTHIHLDHAGAAGSLVRENPNLVVYVSEVGAPHLVDPTRLLISARRLYGDEFERLWGEVVPIPADNVHLVGGEHDGDAVGLLAFDTPGHAAHHVSFLREDGSCFVGDATGVLIPPSSHLLPASPPPDVHLEAWEVSLGAIDERAPTRLWLTHFGSIDAPEAHITRMRERLAAWAGRVREGMTPEAFADLADAELSAEADAETAACYRQAAPFWQSYAGLERYWHKHDEGVGGEG